MPSLKIVLSRHAKKQMKWRRIAVAEVEETVLHPEEVRESIQGRKNALKHINEKHLKVTFAEKGDTIVVVTAIDKNQ